MTVAGFRGRRGQPKCSAERRLADARRRLYHRHVSGFGREDTSPWLFGIACLLAVVTLVRALLLLYLLPPDSFWNVARIGLGFAVFALTARFATALGKQHVSVRSATFALAVPVAIVAMFRLDIGAPYAAVLAGAACALAGGIAGAVIGEMIASGRPRAHGPR